MNYLVTIHGRWLLTAFLVLTVHLSESSPVPQGKRLPFLTSDVKEVSKKSFDFIIVGGGTAGCPLAATLSEKYSVLVVERGGSPYENPLVWNRMYYGLALLQTDEFSSAAQRFTSEEGVPSHRGRVLGGSSGINAAFYSRASDDFVKRVGWDEELVKEAYEWVESRVVFKPELTAWQSALKFCLLEAGFLPYNGFIWEHIEGTKIGGTIYDKNGTRHTSADLLRAGNPEKITVLLNATVKNIIFHGNGNERIARGIRFIKSDGSTNQTYEAYLKEPEDSSLKGEVILSAGALGSPQILMLSGIGPEKHLKDFGIPLVLNLKGVGREMQDNPAIAYIPDSKAKYQLSDTPQVAGIAKDFKFIIEGGIVPINSSSTLTRTRISIKLAFPESKGMLKLNSTDPRQNPSVKFNYLSNKKDLDSCVEMARLLQRISRTKSVVMFLKNGVPNNQTSSTDKLREFCKKNVRTFYHYHGGCTVRSVVDRDYKVYGVENLRVIDGSTLLESPGTNPMATLLMLGRYQGIKILRERDNIFVSNSQKQP
ncbi:protein HOTHEAD-like [Mercurialis annua]|uniref:protein HOTHEAD-like n=1 Tax=Mercurialis annua TaxID=3986 RepID=UPI002160D04D|nr:protein HOTHEAD-like [Mercurialis annua]